MSRVLAAWIGHTDLRASKQEIPGLGPIGMAATTREFDRIYVLSNYSKEESRRYEKWLRAQTAATVATRFAPLSSPTSFAGIYTAAADLLEEVISDVRDTQLTLHLSPGTPAMAAVWVILGKTRFPAELIQSSIEKGVETASVPFDISADFLPDLLREPDTRLQAAAEARVPEISHFGDIVSRSSLMATLIQRARRVAVRDVPVLIEGESGTGKELMARAIHAASTRRSRAFVTVNCGAIPRELVESQLFGHEKGSFTGAIAQHAGFFEQANGGTIFLDEIGELPLDAQVKLLRVLQEREVRRVGAQKSLRVDVRVIAATNRELIAEVAAGRFRADLFYRLAVAVLNMPPLRDRKGDLSLLIDHLLDQVNSENATQPGFTKKKLSAGAKNVLLNHPWPGNVRELLNTLHRLVVWTDSTAISAETARESLISIRYSPGAETLNRPLGNGFDLRALLDEVARHYLERAMLEASGNKTRAAELTGLPSYQTLSNWLERYRVGAG